MINNIIWYLMIGVVIAWLYDFTANKISPENRFNNTERVIVILVWPIAVLMYIWAFIKTMIDQ